MFFRIFLLCLVAGCCSLPEAGRADDAELVSPEILPDHRVTFRLEDPQADSVKLIGVQRIPTSLTKSKEGIWSVTLGPLAPGVYGYSFLVDGIVQLDPSNPSVKPERDPDESELEILSSMPLFYQWQDVPHGTIHLHDYFSKPLRRLRRLRVYTPPDYEKNTAKHYPVLYLFHGTGDTEATWTEFGHAHFILDNLLSMNAAKPMIVVMLDGHADLKDEEGIGRRNCEQLEADLLQTVVPMVDHTYRTVADRDSRAICGLSMGAVQSMFIGLRNLPTFAWLAGMSGFVPDAEEVCGQALNDPATNSKIRLFWHQLGRDDYLMKEYEKFDAVLEKHGIHRQFRITEGDHSWGVWRMYLSELAPVLFKAEK